MSFLDLLILTIVSKYLLLLAFLIELSVGVAKASPRLHLPRLWEAGETRQPSENGSTMPQVSSRYVPYSGGKFLA
jgi:hypothetical protein